MRARRVVAFAISLSCGNVIHSPGFSQEYRGTMGQQMACTPDVWRLCSAQVPDVDRACGETLRSSAGDAARSLNRAIMRPDLATIRCGLTIVTMSRGPTIIATMSRGPTANMDRGLTRTKIRPVRQGRATARVLRVSASIMP